MLQMHHTATRWFSAFSFLVLYILYICISFTEEFDLESCRERASDASRLLLVQSSQLWDAFEPKSVDAFVLDRTCLWMILNDG